MACFFFFASRAIFNASKINKKITDCKLTLLRDRHIRSGRHEAFSEFLRVVALHRHAYPWKLHPNPSFVIIISGRFLIELKFFFHCFSIQVLQIFEVFRLWFLFFFLYIFYFGYQIIRFDFLFRILALLILFVVDWRCCAFISFQRYLF